MRPKKHFTIYKSYKHILATLFLIVVPFLFFLVFAGFAKVAIGELSVSMLDSLWRMFIAYIISMVLGNHEIFALALMLGAIEPKSPSTHTLDALFLASDRSDLINWLRSRPIIIKDKNNIFVHAGILPSWTVDQALDLATQVHEKLVGLDPANFLKEYFENINNNTNNPDISLALASFTLMRLVSSKSEINLNYSGTLQDIPDNLKPWFKLRDDKATHIFFGHWAALGVYNYKNYHCLDSGCGWGRCLSALRLEDRMLFQVDNCDLKYIES